MRAGYPIFVYRVTCTHQASTMLRTEQEDDQLLSDICGLGLAICDAPFNAIRAKQKEPKTDMNVKQDLELWQMAVDKSPGPCAFVGVDDKFLHVNKAWCMMVGYATSELLDMRWLDITRRDDSGGDLAEVESIRDGVREEYYLEKAYIRKDGQELMVGLYVHRYPMVGAHAGYVVFAKPKTAAQTEYGELKKRFQEMERMVLLFQHNEQTTTKLEQQLQQQNKEIRENRELLLRTFGHEPTVPNSVNIGDAFGNSGHKGHSNDTKVFMYVAGAFAAMMTGFIVMAIVVAWVAYYGNGGGQVPPDINQPTVIMPQEGQN